jgi:hypothetical protein
MTTVLCNNSEVIHINSLSTESVMTTGYYSCLLDKHLQESIQDEIMFTAERSDTSAK